MKYKAVISDLDGTLLNGEHRISEYTKEVIKKIIDSGVKFFIATGRHHKDVAVIKKMMDLDTIMITSNGARVHDGNDVEIYAKDLPAEIAKEIANTDIGNDIHMNIYAGDYWYLEEDALWAKDFYNHSEFTYEKIKFKDLGDTKITKFFYLHEDPKIIENLEKEFNEKYQDKINIVKSLPICLEIMHKDVSKGIAITEVLKKEGIKLSEAISFGDGLNDVEMLSITGKGFIMENGNEELKKLLPELEVIKSNSEDGVAKKLEEIFL